MVVRIVHGPFFLGWSFYGLFEPLLLRARASLVALLNNNNEFLVAIDMFFVLLLCILACLAWCLVIRSAQDITLALLKLMLLGAIASTLGALGLTLLDIAARDDVRIQTFLNQTAAFVFQSVRQAAAPF